MTTAKRLRSRGFTLLELLIVLGLIGMVLALAWPSLESSLESSQLPAAAQDVQTLLREGRRLAFQNGIVYRVDVEPQSGELRAVPDVEEDLALAKPVLAVDEETPETIERTLPTGIAMCEVKPAVDEDAKPALTNLPPDAALVNESSAGTSRPTDESKTDAPVAADKSWRLFARLYPDGTADEARLVLSDPKVRRVEVRLQSLAGDVDIRDLPTQTRESSKR